MKTLSVVKRTHQMEKKRREVLAWSKCSRLRSFKMGTPMETDTLLLIITRYSICSRHMETWMFILPTAAIILIVVNVKSKSENVPLGLGLGLGLGHNPSRPVVPPWSSRSCLVSLILQLCICVVRNHVMIARWFPQVSPNIGLCSCDFMVTSFFKFLSLWITSSSHPDPLYDIMIELNHKCYTVYSSRYQINVVS